LSLKSGALSVADASALQREKAEYLHGLEEEIFLSALNIVEGALSFAEVDPSGMMTVPDEWVNRFGRTEAEKRFRIAQMACMPSRDIPAGMKIAMEVFQTIVRCRSDRDAMGSVKTLNVMMMQLPAPSAHVVETMDEQTLGLEGG
jgi:hypothetical protein